MHLDPALRGAWSGVEPERIAGTAPKRIVASLALRLPHRRKSLAAPLFAGSAEFL